LNQDVRRWDLTPWSISGGSSLILFLRFSACLASWRFIWLLGLLLAPAAFAAAIAVDIGHYVTNPGVHSARGVPEFEYNLRLGGELAAGLRDAGHKVLLIGDNGLAEDLGGRAPRAHGMDLFISIHHDSVQPHYLSPWEWDGAVRSYSDRFSGFSLFVSQSSRHAESSLKCASAIGAALNRNGFAPSRYHAAPIHGENRSFADEANGVHYFDNLAVLRTADIPALLFEAGVIVNRDEEMRMRDPAVRRRIVQAVVTGVERCLRHERQ
jgi:N-acetylmuramoyl-L-alanine amidase